MLTQKLTDLIEYLQSLVPGVCGNVRGKIRETELLLLAWLLWQAPLASADDLAALGIWRLGRIYALLHESVNRGLAGFIHQGGVGYVQNRYFLHRKGAVRVMNELKVELEWQVTERGLKRITQYLLMIEVVYGLAPNLWKSNAVRDPFLSSTGLAGEVDGRPLYEGRELVRFHWIRRGRVHAVGEYIDSDGSRIWVPFIWFGRHHKRETRSTLEVLFQYLETSPDFLSGEPASPAGVVIVVADRLSGFRVKRDFALGIPTAVVSAEGELIEKMEPGFPSGYFGVPTDGAIN